jgi:hypothetical protein
MRHGGAGDWLKPHFAEFTHCLIYYESQSLSFGVNHRARPPGQGVVQELGAGAVENCLGEDNCERNEQKSF